MVQQLNHYLDLDQGHAFLLISIVTIFSLSVPVKVRSINAVGLIQASFSRYFRYLVGIYVFYSFMTNGTSVSALSFLFTSCQYLTVTFVGSKL